MQIQWTHTTCLLSHEQMNQPNLHSLIYSGTFPSWSFKPLSWPCHIASLSFRFHQLIELHSQWSDWCDWDFRLPRPDDLWPGTEPASPLIVEVFSWWDVVSDCSRAINHGTQQQGQKHEDDDMLLKSDWNNLLCSLSSLDCPGNCSGMESIILREAI